MSCKFNQLTVGEKVIIKIGSGSYCATCNYPLPEWSGPARYTGHQMILQMYQDTFDLLSPYPCPGCGLNLTPYVEPCAGQQFSMEIGVWVELPIKEEAHDHYRPDHLDLPPRQTAP